MGFGWHCDSSYQTASRWWRCPTCGVDQGVRGHICRVHHKRICCACFDHLDGFCRDDKPCRDKKGELLKET